MKRTRAIRLVAGAFATALIMWPSARSANVAHALNQQPAGVPSGIKSAPASVDIDGESLVDTAVRNAAEVHTASCSTAGCIASSPMFVPATMAISCPDFAGGTCTYQIAIEAQVIVSNRQNGLYRFLVDGAVPVPGPTDGAGFFRWMISDPISGRKFFQARSYAVTAQVRNTVDFQDHVIEIDIACQNVAAPPGCTASSGLANAKIDVYQP